MAKKITFDPAHRETDRILAKLEKKLKRMYLQASKDAEGKFHRYMRDFVRKDEVHRKQVEAGTWTQKEYDNWRYNQLAYADTLKKLIEVIATDLHNVNKIAMKMARNNQKDVYAENFNYAVYEVEHGLGIDTSFTMYNHDTVENLMKNDPELLPKPSKKRQAEIDASDVKWNMDKLTSAFTASLVAGDSIPKMAQRISSVAQMNRNAAIRNARTMTTGAENSGRIDSYKRAQGMGIRLKERWNATLDDRTRHSHRMVDGETIEVGERFSNGLRFPGDPDGPGYEVYNCRCAMTGVLDGITEKEIDKSDVLQRKLENKSITYEQWKKAGHKKKR